MKANYVLPGMVVALLLFSCTTTPDYVGVWKDSTTLAASGTTVTLELREASFVITVDAPSAVDPDPSKVIISGDLSQSGDTLTATVTKIVLTVGQNEYVLEGGVLKAAFNSGQFFGLTSPTQNVTYSVDKDAAPPILTVSGPLILAVSNGASNSLIGVLQ
jgi:hypothetical protein